VLRVTCYVLRVTCCVFRLSGGCVSCLPVYVFTCVPAYLFRVYLSTFSGWTAIKVNFEPRARSSSSPSNFMPTMAMTVRV